MASTAEILRLPPPSALGRDGRDPRDLRGVRPDDFARAAEAQRATPRRDPVRRDGGDARAEVGPDGAAQRGAARLDTNPPAWPAFMAQLFLAQSARATVHLDPRLYGHRGYGAYLAADRLDAPRATAVDIRL